MYLKIQFSYGLFFLATCFLGTCHKYSPCHGTFSPLPCLQYPINIKAFILFLSALIILTNIWEQREAIILIKDIKNSKHIYAYNIIKNAKCFHCTCPLSYFLNLDSQIRLFSKAAYFCEECSCFYYFCRSS